MGKSLHGCIYRTGLGATFYLPLLGGAAFYLLTTEAEAQFEVRFAGTIRNLGCRIPVNTRALTTTLTTSINGSPGNCSVSITAGATGHFSDAVHSDTLASGDLVCAKFACASGANTMNLDGVWCELETTGAHYSPVMAGNQSFYLTLPQGATRYVNLAGLLPSSGASSETTATKYEVRAPGSIQNLQCHVHANPLSATSTFTLMVNGVAGNNSISIGAGATGHFIDVTHGDTVVAGDLVDGRFVCGGASGNLTVSRVGFALLGDDTQSDLFVSRSNSRTGTTTVFGSLYGRQDLTTTEANAKIRMPFGTTLSRMRHQIGSFSGATLTIRSRIGGADGNQVVSVTGSGLYTDVTNSDTVSAGDDVNYSFASASSSTADIIWSGITVGDVTPPPPAMRRPVVVVCG